MMKSSMIFFGKCRRMMAVVMLAGACLLVGCSKDEGVQDPDKPEQPEKPAEATLNLSVKDIAFEAAGGWKEFTINSSAAWTITGGNAWCQPGATSGSGKTQVKIMVEAYTGTSDRNVVLTVKAGSLTATLTVTQKAVQALTLTKDKFDLPQEGGDITVEVKSNIEYTVTIPAAYREWITEAPQSKAMVTKSFRFKIAANEDTEKREGYIVISGNSLKDTVYVYQAEGRTLVLSKSELELTADEQELEVELRTNVDYDIEIPDTVSGWISLLPETKVARSDKLRLLIGENEQTEERQAVVIVKDKNSELADTLHIRQLQASTLILGQKEFNVSSEGETLIVELKTNIEYQVVIPDTVSGWLSILPETKALRTDKLQFLVEKNEQTKERQAVVIVKAQNSKLSDTLHIKQFQASSLILGQKEFNVPSEGETLTFELKTNIEYQVIIPDTVSGWVSILPETKALRTDKLRLLVRENKQAKKRQAVVLVKDRNNKWADTLHIWQDAQKEEIPVEASYQIGYQANSTIEFGITNPGCPLTAKISYDGEDKDWLSLSATSGMLYSLTAITISKNTTITRRKAYIDITYDYFGSSLKRYAVIQLANQEADMTDKFDPQFAQVLQEKGYIQDANHITIGDIDEIKSINVNYSQLSSLRGIEYFTELSHLECSQNQLSTLDVSKNTRLIRLDCNSNQLTTLDVSENTWLTYLYCNSNQFSTLDVSKNTRLDRLECNRNQLTTLDVSKNTGLNWLECSENQLSTLDVSKNTRLSHLDCRDNQLTTLDVSKNTGLDWFECSRNQLTTLDVSKNTELSHLQCGGNQFATLDVSKNTGLGSLYCGSKQLTTLDVSKNTRLRELVCSGSQLTTLDVSKNTELTDLTCNSNQLSALDISKNQKLKHLNIWDNPGIGNVFTLYAWFDKDNVPSSLFILGSEGWRDKNNILTALQIQKCNTEGQNYYIILSKKKFVINAAGGDAGVTIGANVEYDIVIPDEAQDWLTYEKEGNQKILFHVTANNSHMLREANVSIEGRNKETSATLLIRQEGEEGFSGTDYVLTHQAGSATVEFYVPSFWQAQISYEGNVSDWLSLSATGGLAGSARLTIQATENTRRRTRKAYIDITYGTKKQRISVTQDFKTFSGTDITDTFDPIFAQMLESKGYVKDATYILSEEITPITDLNVSGTSSNYSNLTSLRGIANFTELTTLDCSFGKITSLDISKNTKLTALTCSNNELTMLDIKNCPALTYLKCNNNKIDALGFRPGLKELDCSNNRFTSWNMNYYMALTSLNCSGNQLVTFETGNNSTLMELNCSNNQLTTLDVSGYTALTSLNCSNNQLTSLPVNAALRTLNCSRNLFSSWDMSNYAELTNLNCSGNKLTSWSTINNTTLRALNCSNNRITKLDMSGYSALGSLTCTDNGLEDLNIMQNRALKFLDCQDNKLTGLNVLNNPELLHLECSTNSLPRLDIHKLSKLTYFQCLSNPGIFIKGIFQLTVAPNQKISHPTSWRCDGMLITLELITKEP